MSPDPERRLDYRIRFGSRVPGLLSFGQRDCITLGRRIYTRNRFLTARTHGHEYCHVEQWARERWRFPIRYLHACNVAGGNRYEAEAERFARLWAHTFPAYP